MQNIFSSLVKFVIAIFFVLIGTIGLFIPWSVSMRTTLVQFFLEDSLAISLFGFAFVVLGVFVIANVIIDHRHKYYVTKWENSQTDIDENLIRDYLLAYMKELFPHSDIPTHLNIKKNRFYIFIDFPYYPAEEQRDLIDKVKNDLSYLFSSKLGYHESVKLSATFRKKA